ncbi:MAG: hypothetical protein HFJ44_02600 [Clostridia bacterium]|jgi:hypothetical protein|nr:hypothetical protein [Clostridia bacterium]
MEIITILQIVLAILVFIILGLIAAYFLMIYMNNRKEEEIEEEALGIKDEELKDFNGMPRESIFKFMEFDEVKDNMIIRKNRSQYVMILQCSGVNYDLMSEEEKIAVEEGFVQFLNTLRFPIQLYIQTRSLNLREIVEEYKARVSEIAQDIEKINGRIQAAKDTKNERLLQKLQFEKRRKERVLDYGMDIAEYVARMSLNKNVLQQRTYLILSYYASETGATNDTPQDEVDAMCFSELYTRAQTAMRSLQASEVGSKILNSEEIAELLYIAYNRDDSEILQFSKALDAQYDALYSSGKDVLEKRQEKLDEAINSEAIELATESIIRADKYKQIEEMKREQRIKEKATELIDQYKDQMDEATYEGAKEEVKKAKVRKTKAKSKEE